MIQQRRVASSSCPALSIASIPFPGEANNIYLLLVSPNDQPKYDFNEVHLQEPMTLLGLLTKPKGAWMTPKQPYWKDFTWNG